jgi:hypothetical protein
MGQLTFTFTICMKIRFTFLFILSFVLNLTAQPDNPAAYPLYTGNNEQIQFQYMNHAADQPYHRFEKVEIGIALPASLQKAVDRFLGQQSATDSSSFTLNPFLEWELKIEAVFTQELSAVTRTVDAFYYREFERNEHKNKWIEKKTGYPFRVRFSPPVAGGWQVEFHVYVHTKRENSLTQASLFQAIDTGSPGFVSIHPNHQNLQRGAQVIFPVGNNLPFPINGNNLLWSGNPEDQLNTSVWANYAKDVRSYGEQGGKFIRILLSPSSSDIEFEKPGNYYDRLNYAWEIDQVVATCTEKDMLIQFNMMLHTPIMISGDYGQFAWDFSDFWPHDWKDARQAYGYQQTFQLKQPSDLTRNELALKYLTQRYRYIISRWGYSTQISLFEILSEPWHMDEHAYKHETPYDSPDGDEARSAVQKLQTYIAAYIKKEMGHTDHLIGAIGHLPIFTVYPSESSTGTPFSVHDESWSDPNIDLICLSTYSDYPNKLLMRKNASDAPNTYSEDERSYAQKFHELNLHYGKPVLISETGQGDNTSACSGYHGYQLDLMRLGFCGVAGFNMWEGFSYSTDASYFDERKLWKSTVMTAKQLNSPLAQKIFNGLWTQGRQKASQSNRKRDVKEMQYYLSEDQTACTGYIYNRSYNIATAANVPNSVCTSRNDGISDGGNPEYPAAYKEAVNLNWDEGQLLVAGLKKKANYTITWYSYENGSNLEQRPVRSSRRGNLILQHPTLVAQPPASGGSLSPILWFEITVR